MAGLLAVALAVLMLSWTPTPRPVGPAGPQPRQGAQDEHPVNGQQPVAQQPAGQQQAPPPPTGSSSTSDLFSIERIRRELERQSDRRPSALAWKMPTPNPLVYRVEVWGYRLQMPDWRERLIQDLAEAQARDQSFRSDFNQAQWQATAPVAWGSPTPFSTSGMAKASGLEDVTGLAGALIKKGIEARQNAAVAKVHEEVLQELAEVAAHNARVAAGQADGTDDTAAKAAEKKKQDEEKKKQDAEKKKKKKDAPGK